MKCRTCDSSIVFRQPYQDDRQAHYLGCPQIAVEEKVYGDAFTTLRPKEYGDCPDCEGEGYLWDETACGDPDHCAPQYNCPRCEGTGKVEKE